MQYLPCDNQCKCWDFKKEKGTFDIHVGRAPKRGDGSGDVDQSEDGTRLGI